MSDVAEQSHDPKNGSVFHLFQCLFSLLFGAISTGFHWINVPAKQAVSATDGRDDLRVILMLKNASILM
jgi:hypothetical protein